MDCGGVIAEVNKALMLITDIGTRMVVPVDKSPASFASSYTNAYRTFSDQRDTTDHLIIGGAV
jgi:hypothetical protein